VTFTLVTGENLKEGDVILGKQNVSCDKFVTYERPRTVMGVIRHDDYNDLYVYDSLDRFQTPAFHDLQFMVEAI